MIPGQQLIPDGAFDLKWKRNKLNLDSYKQYIYFNLRLFQHLNQFQFGMSFE